MMRRDDVLNLLPRDVYVLLGVPSHNPLPGAINF
jgi:hypothetical protein